MKLILAFIAAIRGDDDYTYDDISIDDLMSMGDPLSKWGQTQRCIKPSTAHGNWVCKNAKAPVYGRKRREGDENDLGRWGYNPQVDVMVCKIQCHNGYELVGNEMAVCQYDTGYWRKPVNAVCKYIRPQCRDITAKIGTFKCHGSVYDRVCQLHCPAGYTEGSLGSYYQCLDGKWPRYTDCIAKNYCAMPRQKPIEWRGKYVCKRKQCETGAPNSAQFASGRRRRSLDGEFNDADIQDLEVGDRGLFDDLNLDEVSRWGAPSNNECIVCYLNCDPIHQAKSGFRAQCRITDGVWFEPMNPKCHFGHNCYWPSAGPMGEYNCESNLFDLGYRGEEWDIVYEPMKGSPEHQNGNWQKKPTSKPRGRREEGEGLGPRWFPPPVYTTQPPPPTPPPTRPPPAPTIKPTPAPWWGAEWTCTINCARWHYPKNGRATATCLLRNSQWTGTATECIYRSPCAGTPRTSNGVGGFQCWEATTVNTGGTIVKRSADNSTDTGDFTPSPLGRWGAPTGKPVVDKTNWDFNVQKVCLLACPDCYNPSQHKSICINGEWQKGYGGDTHGRCVMEERCPDRPWWPIGNGQWSCNGFENKQRTCSLRCDPFHIHQPYAKPLPVPPTLDPAKIFKNTKKPSKINPQSPPTCQPKMPIPNGWMECHVGKAIQNCMIMCNQGMRPTSQKLYAVCKNGMMFPGTPQKDTRWSCVSGHCDHATFGQACYDHPQNGRKRRSIESFNDNMLAAVAGGDGTIDSIHDATNAHNDDMLAKVSVQPDYPLPDNQFADDDQSGAIARWGVSVSSTATCDNCDGYWKNQIKCVFNTKCARPLPPANGSIQCARDPKGAMTHRCNVTCQKDYKLWPPGCSMSCDPHGGVWSKCTCEWNKKCDVPIRPNAQYYCETKNGIFECALVCKGNGQYVPAVWPDIWKFQCKRGDWIERNPQGCKYEPPCVPPKVPNAYLKNCRTERCLAPRKVYEELMPGQYNYKLTATQQGMAGSTQNAAAQMMQAMGMGSSHVGYTGRKRRATALGFFEGETYQTDDRYVVNDNAEDDDGADRWGGGGNLFGVCPLRRSVSGGVIHCHTIVTETVNGAAIIGHDAQLMSSGTTGVVVPEYTGGEVENPGRCQQRHMIHNGWMECKPSSNGNWICMIMCNDLHRPTSTNLYANCNGGHIPGQWSCVPGSCNPNVYQEACWNPAHPGNPPVNPIGGGGSSNPPAIIPTPGGNVQNPGRCQSHHMIENGWMECKPSSNGSSTWVCMIMCNNMTRPTSTNLFANCNGGHIPGSWMCVPGSCDPSIYKEACYNPSHPGNPPTAHGRKRRELDYNKIVDYVNYKPEDEVEPPIDEETLDRQESMAEEWKLAEPTTDEDLRWFPPPPATPPPPIVIEVAMCSLRCNYGYMIDPKCKSTSYECDTMTGVFTPPTSSCGCVPKPTPKPTEVMVWAKCMCCDVKCPQWYRGGGVAKCTKGYWWKIDSCTKYNMCKQPGNPDNGEYNCYWSDTGPTGRKRRAVTEGKEWNGPVDRDSIDYDRSDPEEERTLDDENAALQFAGTPDSVRALQSHPGTNGTVERLPEEIDGLRWASVPTQPQLICNLKCKPGFIPKRRQAVCVDSHWLSKPTVCVKDPHYDPWTPPKCQCKLPKHANKDPSGKWHCKTLMLDPNARSVEDDMKLAEADGYSLITDESTMEGLVEEHNFMERWHSQKQKLKPYLVCKLKCAKDHNVKGGQIAKCDMKTGSWVQQATGKCVAKPWDPTDSKCHCPKGKVKNGAWKCKTVLSSEFRSEDYSEDEGYTIITEKSTISELMSESGVAERWHQEPKKQLVMVCRLDCDRGYSAAGSKKASCVLKTNQWYGDFDGYCKKDPEPNKCKVPTKASNGDWYCTYDMLHDDRSENEEIPEDEWLAMEDGITLDDVDRHKKKKKHNYDCHHCGTKHLVCVLRCNNKYEAHPSDVAKCNTHTGEWVKKQGKCRPKWEPKCDIPSTQKGGYWNCATMLTDPKAPREAELPELHDVTGLTTADLVSRNVGMTERWYAEPELEYMLVCQLTCNSQHRPHGHDVIKCNLDTGFWNKPTPECIANNPVDPWDPYKHGKCKVPKSHGKGTWSCKTKMYSHDRTDEFEDDGEGYMVVDDDTEVGRLLDASGVGERWHKEPKKQIYLMCKLDCPWGHSVYGAANIKCNCKNGGWNKNPGYCLAEKMPSAPSSGEKLSLGDIANSDEEPSSADSSADLDSLANGDSSSDRPAVEDERGHKKKKKKDKKDKKKKDKDQKEQANEDCDAACKKAKKKMKKIAKKCKSDPNLKICAKLPSKDRSEDSDEGGDRSDDFDQMLPDFSEICGTNRKCVKREWRRFCSLNPTNVYC